LKFEGKKTLYSHVHGSMTLKLTLKTGSGLDSSGIGYSTITNFCEHNNDPLVAKQLSASQKKKKDAAPWKVRGTTLF
jgi:hypothetical protein